MDYELTIKIGFFLVAAISAFGLALQRVSSSKRLKADLLTQLEHAIDAKQKHRACELFYHIHGLRLSFKEIKQLISCGEGTRIIHALKMTPGLIEFKSGRVVYRNMQKRFWFRNLRKWTVIFLSWLFGFAGLFTIWAAMQSTGAQAIQAWISTIGFSVFLGVTVSITRDEHFIADLIETSAKKN